MVLREFLIRLNDDDYHDFSRIANEYGLSVEEKIYEIIEFYLLVGRRKFQVCHFKTKN